MTQKDILESVLNEIKHIKTNMPNGELKQMQSDMSELKEDISEMKYLLKFLLGTLVRIPIVYFFIILWFM